MDKEYMVIPVITSKDVKVNRLIKYNIDTLLNEGIRADGAVDLAESIMIYLSRKCGISVTEVAEGLLTRAQMTDKALQSTQMKKREQEEVESLNRAMMASSDVSFMKH